MTELQSINICNHSIVLSLNSIGLSKSQYLYLRKYKISCLFCLVVRCFLKDEFESLICSDGVEHSTSEYEYEYRKKLRVRVLILKNVLEYEYRKKVRVRVRVLLQV